MTQEEKDSADVGALNKAIDLIIERFDTVHIFATRHNPSEQDGATEAFQIGRGNWYARYGQIEGWIEKRKERGRAEARKEMEDEP